MLFLTKKAQPHLSWPSAMFQFTHRLSSPVRLRGCTLVAWLAFLTPLERAHG
jgi:hypothetical protein